MTEKSILEYWPIAAFKPRPTQVKTLLWLEAQTKKYMILELPVGAGKSLIGITYSRYLSAGTGDSYILTPQKILQAQYEAEVLDDKKTLSSIYGKSNYQCIKHKTTCDIGGLLKDCVGSCQYSKAIANSKVAPNTVMNYTIGLLMFGYTEVYDQRELMICDEGHNLEEMLVNFNLLTISRQRCDSLKVKMTIFNNITEGYKWLLSQYLPKLILEVEELEEEVKDLIDSIPDKLSKFQIGMIKKYESAKGHLGSITDFLNVYADTYEENFVMSSDNFKLEFKPVYGKDNFEQMLKHKSNRMLIMSGTILDKSEYCKNLGLDDDDVAFLSLDSEFSPKSRQVVYMPSMKMNASWHKPENVGNLKDYMLNLDMVLKSHLGESGVIHTGNFKIAEYLVDHLQKSKFRIYHHNPESGNDRNSIIKEFQEDSVPRILISPSVTEGLDLKNDRGRFNIIAKLPFPYLGCPWIKKRMTLSDKWYALETAKSIMQACGRVVRSDTDYGTTYILDGSWSYFYYKNSQLFPQWWKDSYIQF